MRSFIQDVILKTGLIILKSSASYFYTDYKLGAHNNDDLLYIVVFVKIPFFGIVVKMGKENL